MTNANSPADGVAIHIRTFGGLAVERSGVALTSLGAQRKRLALLALLVGHEHGLSREKLFALLWPESDLDQARNALNQLLFVLRRELGTDSIVGSAEVRLNGALIASDVVEFRRRIDAGDLETAAALYRGPFLDGFHLRDAPEFERWVDDTARRLTAAYTSLLEQLAVAAGDRDDGAAAVRWWKQLADVDPLNARIAQRLITALAANGERETAIKRGALHISLVRAELDADPDPAIAALMSRLRDESCLSDERASALATSPPIDVRLRIPTNGNPAFAGVEPLANRGRRRPILIAGIALGTVTCAAAALLFLRARDIPAVEQPAPAITSTAAVDSVRTGLAISNSVSGAQSRRSEPIRKRRVLVMPLENRTGDSTLSAIGELAADWVTQGLQRAGMVSVVDPLTTLAISGKRPTDTVATPQTIARRAAESARSVGADWVVWGGVYRRADTLLFQAQIGDVQSGNLVATFEPVLVRASKAMAGAEQLRSRVSGALATLTDARVASLAPVSPLPTYEAYTEYVAGLALFTQAHERDARPHFLAAAKLDTSFVLPLLWAAFVDGNERDSTARDSIVQTIARHRRSLSTLDQRGLDYLIATRRHDAAAATEAARAAARLAPGSHWSFIAGELALSDNRVREAVHWFNDIDPEHGWAQQWFAYWDSHMTAYHLLGDYQRELNLAVRAGAIGSFGTVVRIDELRALIGLGRVEEALGKFDDVLRALPRSTPAAEWMLDIADELRAHHYSARADELVERAARWSGSTDGSDWVRASPDTAAASVILQRVLGTALYDGGKLDSARVIFTRQAEHNPADYRPRSFLGLIAARSGDRAKAERVVLLLETMPGLPSGRALRQGRILSVLGETDRAMRYFETAVPMSPGSVFTLVHRVRDWKPISDMINVAFNPNRVFARDGVPGQW